MKNSYDDTRSLGFDYYHKDRADALNSSVYVCRSPRQDPPRPPHISPLPKLYAFHSFCPPCPHLSQQLRAPVDHGAQDLCRHDDAKGVGVKHHIASHQADVAKLFCQLAVLLVGQGLGVAGGDRVWVGIQDLAMVTG